MCDDCWRSYGAPTELPPDANDLLDLIEDLYGQDRCVTGGPLHSFLSNWNLEDPEPYGLEDWAVDPEVVQLATAIGDAMAKLTLIERAAVLAASDGIITRPQKGS